MWLTNTRGALIYLILDKVKQYLKHKIGWSNIWQEVNYR